MVVKALAAIPDAAFPTRLVGPEAKAYLAQIRFAPAILQEYVEADVDVRAVVVGDEVFAADIASAPSAYPHDYRVDLSLARVTPCTLPDGVAQSLVALTRRLGLAWAPPTCGEHSTATPIASWKSTLRGSGCFSTIGRRVR